MTFKILLEYGRTGIAAGGLSERLGVPHNTLSFHLSHLSHAGLVSSHKQGRSVIYKANCDATDALVAFLVENCCIRESQDGAGESCSTSCKPVTMKGKKK